MKRLAALVFCLWLQGLTNFALAELAKELAAPLNKVLQLMDDLSERVVAEGDKADKAYHEHFEWCDDAASEKRHEIKTLSARQEKLTASIDKLTSSATVAATKVEELGKGVAKETAQLADATAVRESEAAQFAEDEAELMDTVDTLGRAVAVLEREMEKNKAAFAQMDLTNFRSAVHTLGLVVDAAGFSVAGKQKLLALVQQSRQDAAEAAEQSSDAEDGLDAPAPAVYESKSGSIVDVIEDLKEKADNELQELRAAESTSKQNYAMLKQSLEDSMSNAGKDMEQAKAYRSKSEGNKAAAQGELQSTTKALEDAKAKLAELKQVCMQTAADHEKSVAARKQELEVIAEAKKHLEDSISNGAPADFLQIAQSASVHAHAGSHAHMDLRRAEVLTVVNRLARTYHSSALARLSSRISAELKLADADSLDPFAKIRAMISDLIGKLEAQAQAAAEEKAYCDDEMAKTKEKKDELSQDLDGLSAKIDKAAATSTGLKNEAKELQAELAKLAKLQAEMDKVRKAEHDVFVEEKADMLKAIDGVRRALAVLRQYYGKDEAASLLESSGGTLLDIMRQPKPLVSFGRSQGAGSGIIGILEVCESDFVRELSKVTTEEEDAQGNYDDTTQANKKEVAMKDKELEHKVRSFKGLDKTLADLAEDKDTLLSQQAAVVEYWSRITARCVAKPEPYEERKQRREQEVAGLKEALSILESESALVQQGTSTRSRGTRGFLGTD